MPTRRGTLLFLGTGTSHGVPCFGMKAAYDFFTGLP